MTFREVLGIFEQSIEVFLQSHNLILDLYSYKRYQK